MSTDTLEQRRAAARALADGVVALRASKVSNGIEPRADVMIQVALLPVANEFLLHWSEALRSDHVDVSGPLASLLAEVVVVARRTPANVREGVTLRSVAERFLDEKMYATDEDVQDLYAILMEVGRADREEVVSLRRRVKEQQRVIDALRKKAT